MKSMLKTDLMLLMLIIFVASFFVGWVAAMYIAFTI